MIGRCAPTSPLVRTAALLLVVSWVATIGFQWGLSSGDVPREHGHNTTVLSLDLPAAVLAVDHPHVVSGSMSQLPDVFAAQVPNRTIASVVLGFLALTCMVSVKWLHSSVGVRGPPPAISLRFTSGRAILARLCIARR